MRSNQTASSSRYGNVRFTVTATAGCTLPRTLLRRLDQEVALSFRKALAAASKSLPDKLHGVPDKAPTTITQRVKCAEYTLTVEAKLSYTTNVDKKSRYVFYATMKSTLERLADNCPDLTASRRAYRHGQKVRRWQVPPPPPIEYRRFKRWTRPATA